MRYGRRFFIRLPSSPRCVLCASPFAGPFAPLLRLLGKGRFPKNPRYCDHTRQAVLCGLQILRDTGHGEADGPWIPVGVGVHTGVAFIGTVGRGGGGQVELTAIGEAVNLAARLASVAGTGEVVVSEVAFAASGTDADPERRTLTLKGISGPVPARVLTLSPEPAATA